MIAWKEKIGLGDCWKKNGYLKEMGQREERVVATNFQVLFKLKFYVQFKFVKIYLYIQNTDLKFECFNLSKMNFQENYVLKFISIIIEWSKGLVMTTNWNED